MHVARGLDAPPALRRPRSSSSSACSTASTWATPTCWSTSSRRPRAAAARPGRHHLRPPPRRDHHRVRAAAAVRPRRAPRAPRRRGRGHDGRRPLRPAAARDDLRRVRRDDRGPGAARRVPHDARRGVRLPARGDPRDARGARARSAGFDVVVVPPFELDGRPVRSTEVRAAIAAGDLALAAAPARARPLRRGPGRDRGRRGPGPCSASRCRSPCRPTARYRGRGRARSTPARPTRPIIEGWIGAARSGRRRRPGSASRSTPAPDRRRGSASPMRSPAPVCVMV